MWLYTTTQLSQGVQRARTRCTGVGRIDWNGRALAPQQQGLALGGALNVGREYYVWDDRIQSTKNEFILFWYGSDRRARLGPATPDTGHPRRACSLAIENTVLVVPSSLLTYQYLYFPTSASFIYHCSRYTRL